MATSNDIPPTYHRDFVVSWNCGFPAAAACSGNKYNHTHMSIPIGMPHEMPQATHLKR